MYHRPSPRNRPEKFADTTTRVVVIPIFYRNVGCAPRKLLSLLPPPLLKHRYNNILDTGSAAVFWLVTYTFNIGILNRQPIIASSIALSWTSSTRYVLDASQVPNKKKLKGKIQISFQVFL